MIVDRIENAHLYYALGEDFKKAFEVLKTTDFSKKEKGRHETDNKNVYYMMQRYATKPVEQARYEAHQKMIDIQYVVSGEEIIGYGNIGSLELMTPYDSEKEAAFYMRSENYTAVKLYKGMFAIFFPEDGHMPGLQLGGQCDVEKVVVKLPVNF